MLSLRGKICIEVGYINHPFAPGWPPGRCAVQGAGGGSTMSQEMVERGEAMSTPRATSVVNTFAFPCWCRVLHAYTTFLPEKLPNFKLFQSPCVPEVPQHGQIVQQRSILTARIDSLSLESGGFEPKSCQLTSVVNTFAFPGCGALGVAGGCRETKQFGVNEPAGVEQMGHT